MRTSKIITAVLAGAAALSGIGVAAARSGGLLALPAALALPAPAAAVDAPREVDLPTERQMELGREYVARIEQATSTVRTLLEQARAARDVVKALCLNDKLTQIEVAGRTAKDRSSTLQTAGAAKEKDRAKHEFTILLALRDRVDQLVKESNQCIGEEAGFTGDSQVSVQVDPNIPNNDPGQLGVDPTIITDPPVLSSPTM